MSKIRRLILTGVSALALTASLQLTTACRKSEDAKAHAGKPEAFTAQLTEIQGVQALYTLRHPKLINQELEKLMTEIPEASLARMFLGQLAPYGYPEFSELAAGSNIGIALLEVSANELAEGNPTFVAFAKLKEGGKIWTILSHTGLVLQKQGEWVWIAKDASSFAKVKDPAAVIAQIEKSQDEEIRAWGRISPALLAQLKETVFPQIQAKLSSRTPAEQKAILAYADVLWGYLAQLHSGGGSLDLNDQGIALSYYGQFLPDSATGKFFRYAHGPSPKIADSVPSDGLFSIVARQNVPAQIDFVSGVLDSLIAVDYPAGADALRKIKTTYIDLSKHNDGGAVLTMDLDLPSAGQPPEIDMFGVYTGSYTEAEVSSAYKHMVNLSKKLTDIALQAASSLSPHAPVPEVQQVLNENALTIDGVKFGSIVTTTTLDIGGEKQVSTTTQYFGVVKGNLVIASNEESLREKLPALAAKRTVANPVKVTLKNDEIGALVLHGEKLIDTALKGATLDTADADIKAQLKALKDGYASSQPVKATVSTSQAKASVTVSIPYKFISNTVRVFQFASAHKTEELNDLQPAASGQAGQPQ